MGFPSFLTTASNKYVAHPQPVFKPDDGHLLYLCRWFSSSDLLCYDREGDSFYRVPVSPGSTGEPKLIWKNCKLPTRAECNETWKMINNSCALYSRLHRSAYQLYDFDMQTISEYSTPTVDLVNQQTLHYQIRLEIPEGHGLDASSLIVVDLRNNKRRKMEFRYPGRINDCYRYNNTFYLHRYETSEEHGEKGVYCLSLEHDTPVTRLGGRGDTFMPGTPFIYDIESKKYLGDSQSLAVYNFYKLTREHRTQLQFHTSSELAFLFVNIQHHDLLLVLVAVPWRYAKHAFEVRIYDVNDDWKLLRTLHVPDAVRSYQRQLIFDGKDLLILAVPSYTPLHALSNVRRLVFSD